MDLSVKDVDMDMDELKAELESKEKIPFEVWLHEYKSSDNPFKRLSLIFKLPFCCEQFDLDERKAKEVAEHFPSNLISQFLLQQRDEDVVDLVVTMVNILVPLSNDSEKEKFRPLCEGIRESLCEGNGLTENDVELRLNALSHIGVQYLSVDDLNAVLNILLGFIKDNVDQFPSKTIMSFVVAGLKSLSNVFDMDNQLNAVALSWPATLRTVIERLLRTYSIPDEYTSFAFVSGGLTSQILGPSWVVADKKLFQLLASMTSGRIRIVTEDPKKINGDELVCCFQLAETFVQAIEDEKNDINDELATAVGKSMQQMASFCCEYLGTCGKEQVVLDIGIKLAFYRFICMFASVGGLEIVSKEHLNGTIGALLDVFEYTISQRDHKTAGLFVMHIPDFPSLPTSTLALLLKYVQLVFPVDKELCVSQFSQILHDLKGRKQFFTQESLQSALTFANNIKNSEMRETISSFTIRLTYYIGKIPGPFSLPIVGTTWQFKWKIEELTEQLLQWQIYYQTTMKEDLIRIWLGPFPIVAVLSPKATKAILESNDYLTKGDEYKIMERWLGQGLLTSKGDKWRGRRKMITPAFHFSMLNQYHQVHDEEAKILVDVLEKFAISGETFDGYPYIKRCALDIICATAMGIKVDAQTYVDHPYVNAVKQMNELSFVYSRMPWLWLKPIWYLSGFGQKYDACLKLVTDFTRNVIKQRSDEFHSENLNDKKRMAFLDLLLKVKEEGGLDNEDIREEVDTFMFEGHDTTSSGMAWTLWCLAHFPEYQRKAWEEVDAVFGGSSRGCTVDDLKRLPYLEQCVKESLRLFPPVPFFTRKLEKDIQCAGYTVPKNTTLLLSPGTLHTDLQSFSDPYKFNPDNFKTENIHGRDAFSYIPFSAGPRNCIGQKFALMEEKTILSWILRVYEVRPAMNFKDNCPCPEIILKPSKGLPITMPRGIFIVFEGLDRSGKSTQSKKIEAYLNGRGYPARIQRYPDREEPTTGPKIDEFLKTAKDVTQDAIQIHNLFVENRKCLDAKIRKEISEGQTIIADRYSFSGVAYSAAKDIPELSLSKACKSEVGLLKPDLVLFLKADSSVTSKREEFGGEAFEKEEFQNKVYNNIMQVFNQEFWKEVNASQTIDEVFEDIKKEVDVLMESRKQLGDARDFSLSDFNVR
ncbi:unnamed protein product [Bursaphelenchus okinawaensis]|uniref:dTMP kinase n=1 Tax=Bursaphelenchus okinawaensis TaxID=465554 RepID=A0A811K7U3_9BILA|nr:unnamed protein product [Bursaphelenchus okinawaensis]CAG9093530.1 unnamed protein product [Bursaphelenchus okinawaensis]